MTLHSLALSSYRMIRAPIFRELESQFRIGGQRHLTAALTHVANFPLGNIDCEGYSCAHKRTPEEIVREGTKAEEITKLIEEDPDIGVLVLGASKDPSGPGPLVTTLAAGRSAGTFPVPITVVPGCLGLEEILALA